MYSAFSKLTSNVRFTFEFKAPYVYLYIDTLQN